MALRKQTNCLPYQCPIDSDSASENRLHHYLNAHHLKENSTLMYVKRVYAELFVTCLVTRVQIYSCEKLVVCHAVVTGGYRKQSCNSV